MKIFYYFLSIFLFGTFFLQGQVADRPTLAAGRFLGEIRIDGYMDEEEWKNAPVLNTFQTTVPIEKGVPSAATLVRVLVNEKSLIIGIQCEDPDPDKIVRFSKLRDTDISNEDHVKVVIDPFLDGQSGYILAVNANAARYDALVSNRGESENEDWDAIWEARVSINESGC
ncbi:carbohydrate binding family 9 domain-containing protein [uncultured Muriicola sp.]|uniref:carbohydrate binding family 9 domain-containing protein n=1 Tax=uncultured Muriicola sp. TaxID=1583102 RepID=UPI002633377F|nr:carbohydrate binding family 9 domain-containing protein [uncultured Muriicola sp.]